MSFDVFRETAPNSPLTHGGLSVGTSRIQLTSWDKPQIKGVLVQAAPSNTANVRIGGKDVNTTFGMHGGLILAPGSSLTVPIEKASDLFCISTENDQHVTWMAI